MQPSIQLLNLTPGIMQEVLHVDLAGPASALYLHNLTSTLETAIRATNAQYDDADTLSRLDVQLFEVRVQTTCDFISRGRDRAYCSCEVMAVCSEHLLCH